MKFNLEELTLQIQGVSDELKAIDTQEKINKYGTFLDSKEEIIQLYILFIFFGIHCDTISQISYPMIVEVEPMPVEPMPVMNEYDPD